MVAWHLGKYPVLALVLVIIVKILKIGTPEIITVNVLKSNSLILPCNNASKRYRWNGIQNWHWSDRSGSALFVQTHLSIYLRYLRWSFIFLKRTITCTSTPDGVLFVKLSIGLTFGELLLFNFGQWTSGTISAHYQPRNFITTISTASHWRRKPSSLRKCEVLKIEWLSLTRLLGQIIGVTSW